MRKILGIVFLLAAGFCVYCFWLLNRHVQFRESTLEVLIPQGSSLHTSLDSLVAHHVITVPTIGRYTAKIYSFFTHSHIQPGVHEFQKEQTQLQALLTLFHNPQTVNVTFPEGITLVHYASIAAGKIGCDSVEFMRLALSDSVRKAHHIENSSLEGYLMPDTYNFFKGTRSAQVLQRLLTAQEKMWREQFAREAKVRGMTKNEVLTLASIVEAETPNNDEKKRVSGVYHNRLTKGMKLQADPTVQYALGGIQRRLYYADLDVNSPYNTYRFAGLPPGPINSPGRTSIEAAIHPEEHNYLYFVAVGDGSNTHEFSRTAAEHERAVASYRAQRRNNAH